MKTKQGLVTMTKPSVGVHTKMPFENRVRAGKTQQEVRIRKLGHKSVTRANSRSSTPSGSRRQLHQLHLASQMPWPP